MISGKSSSSSKPGWRVEKVLLFGLDTEKISPLSSGRR